jgi:capsid assembly protease
MRALPHIFGRVFNTPLIITAQRLEPLVAGLRAASLTREPRPRAEAGDDDDRPSRSRRFEADGAIWEHQRGGYALSPAGIARIGITDVLARRAGQVQADSTELESYARIGSMARSTMNDPRVRGVLLDIDSPGGESGGVFELARDIRAMAGIKPIWAVANDDAMSAAYAIAAATDQIWLTETGGVGSIGVIAMHTDQSGFDAAQGFSFSYVYAGERKTDFNPHQPLSTDARRIVQTEVDRLYSMFVGLVADYRGMRATAVAGTEAGTFHGHRAVSLGLADRIGTFGEAVAAMTEYLGGQNMDDPPVTGGFPPRSQSARPVAQPSGAPAVTTTAEDLNAAQGEMLDQIVAAVPLAAENVVRLDQVRAATSTVRKDAVEIVNLCSLAGLPNLAAEYIGAETTVAAVRADLMRRQTELAAASQVLPIDVSQQVSSSAQTQRSELNEVVAQRFAAQSGRKGN